MTAVGVHEARRQSDAWIEFFTSFEATHAVTLAYNNTFGATASPCYRLTGDGEYITLPTSGVPIERSLNRLATTRRISMEEVHSDLDRLHLRVDRSLCGSHFNRLGPERRSAFLGYIEHPDSNLHVHLLWRAPPGRDGQIIETIEEFWRRGGRYRSSNVQPIFDVKGWASYSLKDQVRHLLDGEATLFVFNRSLEGP